MTDAADDTPATPVDHPRPGRGAVALQVGQFVLVGVVALAIVGLATAIASRRVGEREAIAEARSTTLSKMQGPVEHLVTDELLNGSPAAIAAVDQAVRDGVLDRDLVRVKLWRDDGTIIYSDEPQLIGARYGLDEEEQASLRTGAIQAHVSDLGRPENRFERQYGKLLEVYLPISSASRPVLFEAYYRYSLVDDNGSQLFRSFAPIALGALVVLELVQIPLYWSLARRLRERLREREALLRRTLEASDIERRQIASDLHDGAVQELAGVAYALSAVARRHDVGADVTPVIDESAEAVRQSIRALRSLIVDIYPPDFGEVDLGSALSDLLGRASDQGLDVALDMEGLNGRPVPEATARLLYRAAQEGVRNTLAHAHASTVTVRVATVDSMAVLDVADDGRGVDDTEVAQRRANGHVGLTALGGLVADAGGRLELRPARDHGTTLHVEVPLA